jgi:hypothetical protein
MKALNWFSSAAGTGGANRPPPVGQDPSAFCAECRSRAYSDRTPLVRTPRVSILICLSMSLVPLAPSVALAREEGRCSAATAALREGRESRCGPIGLPTLLPSKPVDVECTVCYSRARVLLETSVRFDSLSEVHGCRVLAGLRQTPSLELAHLGRERRRLIGQLDVLRDPLGVIGDDLGSARRWPSRCSTPARRPGQPPGEMEHRSSTSTSS